MNMRKNSTDLKNISNYPLLALPKVVVMPMIPQPVKIDDEEDMKIAPVKEASEEVSEPVTESVNAEEQPNENV